MGAQSTEVWVASLEYFFNHVLPPILPQIDPDRTFELCLVNKILKKIHHTENYSWKGLTLRPNQCKSSETTIYNKPFMDIFTAVAEAAKNSRKDVGSIHLTSHLHAEKDRISGTMGSGKVRSSAVIYYNNPDDNYPKELKGMQCYNAAFSFHFKRSKKGEYENVKQVLAFLRHTMAVDPCRRFTLAATVEGSCMRLWSYSRSMIITSEPFDFTSDPKTMIKVLISLSFADKVDLGWDSTITAKYDGSNQVFDLQVAGVHYTSDSANIISDTKAEEVYTSATRIYKAFNIDDEDENEPVIIKDYWPAENYITEDITRQRILNDIKNSIERELFQRLTLTPIMAERVKVKGEDDHTEKVILRGESPQSNFKVTLLEEKTWIKGSTAETSTVFKEITDSQDWKMSIKLESNGRESYIHRWHYRIVFKEVAIPYNELRNLSDMILVLEYAVKALRVIHLAGWVHRDLSPGNLYLFIDTVTGEKRGLIGDLEFAKRVGTVGECDGQTGTPDFMAVEIASQNYRFRPGGSSTFILEMDEEDDCEGDSIAPSRSVARGVWANYIHDLESIWWILVWTLFSYQDASRAGSTSEDYKEMIKTQADTGSQLFPGAIDVHERFLFLLFDPEFSQLVDKISDSFPRLVIMMTKIRDILIGFYKIEEEKGTTFITPTYGGRLHDKILKILSKTPHCNIDIVPVQNSNKKEKSQGRAKRTIHDTRANDERPAKKRRTTKATDKKEKISTSGSPALGRSTRVMTLRPRAGRGQRKSNSGGPTVDKSTANNRVIPTTRSDNLSKDTKATPSGLQIGKRSRSNDKTAVSVSKTNTAKVAKRPVRRTVPVLAENSRITRSMVKKAPPVATDTTEDQNILKDRATLPASSGSRKRRRLC